MAATRAAAADRGVSDADEPGAAGGVRSAPCGRRDGGRQPRRRARRRPLRPSAERPVTPRPRRRLGGRRRRTRGRRDSRRSDATRDEFVSKATLGRFRQALSAELGSVAELPAQGIRFRLHAPSRRSCFGGRRSQRYRRPGSCRGRSAAVQDAWAPPQKAGDDDLRLADGQRHGARQGARRTPLPRCEGNRAVRRGISDHPGRSCATGARISPPTPRRLQEHSAAAARIAGRLIAGPERAVAPLVSIAEQYGSFPWHSLKPATCGRPT